MKLRLPSEKLGGAYHLARVIDKIRLQNLGELPEEYQSSYCNPAGLDGLFLKAFKLEADTLVQTITKSSSDQEIVEWFKSQTTQEQCEKWNAFALELGRPGTALGERFKQVRAIKYPELPSEWEGTVFEAIALDESK
ncbi:DUF5069 domain-containing protein [Pelagicoccus sp. SDUM812002]|uniref:DUF5069 domain-containing protein n=1 Tax=Pelagicoccus sp. SDUM812002 TaxID=3041266 RepID=UPI00280DD980|nr:DUF5069 domain-containing protein [Pelagicoccus sp. SDUM812002]MDQ8188194.1 DUF5069 domain-containing protein [Pelagicoccus sp. SDUM812002]